MLSGLTGNQGTTEKPSGKMTFFFSYMNFLLSISELNNDYSYIKKN